MALMYERYGAAEDIEEKPEWEEVQQLQRGWLELLEKQTASAQEALFEEVQQAINEVLGVRDVPVSLDFETATRIVRRAVDRVLRDEAEAAMASGMVN